MNWNDSLQQDRAFVLLAILYDSASGIVWLAGQASEA